MISVVIPTLNEEHHLENLLRSLADQEKGEDIEVIVADAQSSDGTRAVAARHADEFSRLLVVDGGLPPVARNNGARASGGDPIFFIDADIIIPEKDFLARAAGLFREKKLGVASVYLKPRSVRTIDHAIVGAYNWILAISKYLRPLGAMCIVASRAAFEKSGGYPENAIMAEDHDFVLNAQKHGPYDVLPLHVLFSVRRLDKEGRLGLAAKYLKASAYRVCFGPITKPIFKYEFQYTDKENKSTGEL